MAKFDTSTIEGFDSMSVEDKLSALLSADIPDKVDLTQYVSKQISDKFASEAAEYRKKFNAKLTDDEKKAAEEAAAKAEMEEKYNALLKKSTISDFKAQYLAMGYSEKDAVAIAEAQYDGNTAKMFEVMSSHNSSLKEQIKSDLLKNSPKPDGAGGKSEDGKTPDMVIAEKLAKASSESAKKANDALSTFFK